LRVDESVYLGRTWETEAGFPDIAATAMVQTPDGYLWVGTFSQLLRFDGVAFTRITHPDAPGLENEMVLALHVDAAGRLWVGTTRGVGCLDAGRWRWWGEEAGIPRGIVRDVMSDGAGGIYVAVENYLKRWDGDGQFVDVPLPRPSWRGNAPLRIAFDGDGALWALDHAWLARQDDGSWNVLIDETESLDALKTDSNLLGVA